MSEKHSNIEIPWEEIDTILLDMDGTLLDLNFDNYVWNEALPAAYANKHSLNLESARASLIGHMREIQGTISFYSFDYWTRYTELDIIELHRNYAHLVEFRPGARSFLKWAKQAQKTTIIATNAHPDSIMVKDEVCGVSSLVDYVVSSHHYDSPKETSEFWQRLKEEYNLNEKKCLFIDDNAPVLESSEKFGVAYNLIISKPDSNKPTKTNLNYPSFNHYAEICQYLDSSINE